jgi:hypothetical protein
VTATAALLAPPLALLAVGLMMRAAWLGQPQLFRDEAASWYLASRPLNGLLDAVAHETFAPLYPLLLKGWMAPLGNSEAALRSLSVVGGIGTVAVTWRWARDALGSAAAFVAGLLVALSPALVSVDRQARMYAIETFFATAAWWLAWRLVSDGADGRARRGRRRHVVPIGLGLAVAGEVWTMSLGIPMAGLQLAFAGAGLIRLRTRASALAAGCIVAGAVSLAPWLPKLLAVATTGQQFWTPRPEASSLGYTLNGWIVGGLWGAWGVFVALAVALGLLGWAGLARGSAWPSPEKGSQAPGAVGRSRILALALALALALVPGAWAYSQIRPIYDARYFGSAVPPFSIAAAAGILAIAQSLRPRLRLTARLPLPALAGLLALTIGVPMAIGTAANVASSVEENGIDPSRQVVDELAARAHRGDVVLALNAQTYFPLAYYLDSTGEARRLGIELYEFHRPTAAYFTGWQDIASDRIIEPANVEQSGWREALHLPPQGVVWLVALDSHERDFRLFGAYESASESGPLVETWATLVCGNNRVGEIRRAVVVEP